MLERLMVFADQRVKLSFPHHMLPQVLQGPALPLGVREVHTRAGHLLEHERESGKIEVLPVRLLGVQRERARSDEGPESGQMWRPTKASLSKRSKRILRLTNCFTKVKLRFLNSIMEIHSSTKKHMLYTIVKNKK